MAILSSRTEEKFRVGVAGYGYWGPNLARNISAREDCIVSGICDLDPARLAIAATVFPEAVITESFSTLLEIPDLDAVVISTPVASHFELAKAALVAGKDVLVEKPLARSSDEARTLIRLAEKKSLILAVDHTFLFTGAVAKIKQILDEGELGNILYFDSVRVNLGLFQPDTNVIWDLAPHDLSIINSLVGLTPTLVSAVGTCHAESGFVDVAYVHMKYESGLAAHLHLNWLSPVKLRRMLISGSRKMIVYDDMEPSEKVKVYDSGVSVKKIVDADSVHKRLVDYRIGDMTAPKLDTSEALFVEINDFIRALTERKPPKVDGLAGLDVVRVLEAADESLSCNGKWVPVF